uniref:uncharacterized protein LOC109955553 isoform X2 n=1 Tax=Monopterus albus TaxID=43700 RepID=UPI0009B45A5B|nr:uncharacterized protein LOC109955553 isoform X2 [Monopterus albus]
MTVCLLGCCLGGFCSLESRDKNDIQLWPLGYTYWIQTTKKGLVVASAVANQTTDSNVNKENLSNNSSNVTHPVTITTTSITNTATTNITSSNDTGIFPDNFAITDDTNITDVSSTTNPSTTRQEDSDDESSNGGEGVSQNATVSVTTPAPFTSPKSKTATSTTDRNKHTTTSPARRGSGDTIGISILVVIIAVAVVFVIACCFLRKRRERRYSVDLTSRPDEANIPLSTVEPELHIDSVSQNGLQTFENTATTKKESQEPEAKPEVQEEQKADKSVVDPSAESAAPHSSEYKPKQVDAEQSLPAPVELSMEEKTDDEGIVSNKTSVESLKEKNESSNNKAGLTGD